MPKQLSFASYEFGQKKRVTRREKFLGEMEQVLPCARLEALIEPLCRLPSAPMDSGCLRVAQRRAGGLS